jgi:hypothetical protein
MKKGIQNNRFFSFPVKHAKLSYERFVFLLAFVLLTCVLCVNETTDEISPVINLEAGPDTIYVGDSWVDPGFKATDNSDGDISVNVKTSGNVNTSLIGDYVIMYSVEDHAGNNSSIERKICVQASPLLWARYLFTKNTSDSSPDKRNLSAKKGPLFCSDRFGIAGSAVSFSGTEYLIGAANDFPSGNCPKTICGWFRSASTSPLQSLFGIGNAKNQFSFQLTRGPSPTGNEFRVNGWGDNYDWRTGISAAPYFDGKWHHCAVTYDSVITTFYIDGEKKSETSKYVYKTDPANARVLVGIEEDTAGWNFIGDLDDIYIYNRPLSALQINALFRDKNWNGDTSHVKTDTIKKDTSQTPKIVTGLKYQIITGASNDLQVRLTWDAVSGAQGYGVYYNTGKTVTKNDYYRVAVSNSRTLGPELTEGTEYTFAVTALFPNDIESALSSSVTLTFSK